MILHISKPPACPLILMPVTTGFCFNSSGFELVLTAVRSLVCALSHLSTHTQAYRNVCVLCDMANKHTTQTHSPRTRLHMASSLPCLPMELSVSTHRISYKTKNLRDKFRESLEHARRFFYSTRLHALSTSKNLPAQSQIKPHLIASDMLEVLAGLYLQLAIDKAFCCPIPHGN